METVLHVLNGDATLYGFDNSGLDGDTLVWREVLSEGPLSENISSAAFWNARSVWICATFNQTPEAYQADMVDQLGKLNAGYREINLWFDFDLHCQTNLLGAMAMIKQQTDLSSPEINLVPASEFSGVDDFKGMGQLEGDQLAGLFDNRCRLSPYDFELAGEAWKVYVKNDAALLETFIQNNAFWGSMPLLKPALEAQLRRLEVNPGGLNFIEQLLLDIYRAGITDRLGVHRTFWESQRIYGMGDAELNIYLNRLTGKGLISLN